MIQFQENTQTDIRRQGWTDPIQRILPATARGLTSKTVVNGYLKVKDIEHDVVLIKNYYITASLQKPAQTDFRVS